MAMDRLAVSARRLAAVALIVVSSLGLREAFAQSGEDLLLSARDTAGGCGTVSVDYVVDYVPELGAYGVTGAELTGIGPGCQGRTVDVTFTAADGSPLGRASARITVPRTSVVLTEPPAIDAASVGGVSVAVLG